MTAREHIDEIHNTSREFKEHLWTNHKLRDIVPQAMIAFDDGERYTFPIGMVSSIMDKLFYDKGKTINDWPTSIEASLHLGLQAMLGQTTKEVPASLLGPGGKRPPVGAKIRHVFVTCESYVCPPEYEPIVGLDGQDEGDRRLMDDFNNNPESRVEEALMTFVIEDDLCGGVEWAGAIQTFRLDDGGVFVWDDPQYIISDNDAYDKKDVAEATKRNAPVRASIPYFNQEVKAKEAK